MLKSPAMIEGGFRDKWILVTGAGSGIGKETALAFARQGARLIISDISEPSLQATANLLNDMKSTVVARLVSVSDRKAMEGFANDIHSQIEAVDILVNNAGVAIAGGLLDTPLDDWDWIVGINLMGVIHGCHFFIPRMVNRGNGGHVVNMASAAAYSTMDNLVAYGTTKFGVLGLSEGLRQELAPKGIGVTAVCPGFINTPITRNARMLGAYADPRAREQTIRFYRKRNFAPERVALGILKAVEKNRAVAPISFESWFLYYLKRFAPGLLERLSMSTSRRTRRAFTQPKS